MERFGGVWRLIYWSGATPDVDPKSVASWILACAVRTVRVSLIFLHVICLEGGVCCDRAVHVFHSFSFSALLLAFGYSCVHWAFMWTAEAGTCIPS